MSSLKKALDMRRGKGFEISIMVNHKPDKREDLGLAPEVKDKASPEEMMEMESPQDEMKEQRAMDMMEQAHRDEYEGMDAEGKEDEALNLMKSAHHGKRVVSEEEKMPLGKKMSLGDRVAMNAKRKGL